MPVSRLTALMIQGRDELIVTHAGPNENGKYSGWLTLGPDHYCRPLLSTEMIFDSPAAAEQEIRKTIDAIGQMNLLSNPSHTGPCGIIGHADDCLCVQTGEPPKW